MPRFASSSSSKNNKPASKKPASPYAPAAHLLSQILDEKKSFKKLIYDKDGTLKCHKVTYAQVCQVLSYKSILDEILNQVPVLAETVHHNGLLHVLVYELLLGPNQAIRGGGAVKRQLLQHEPALRKAMKSPKIAQQLEDHQAHIKDRQPFPRYARVNSLMISLQEVCQTLQQCNSDQEDKHKKSLEFYMDPHVPNLLVLPPSIVTEAMSSPAEESHNVGDESSASSHLSSAQQTIKSWIQSGKLILQDKSSCFPAYCLVHGISQNAPSKCQDYLDACAAPGNKTQHLAALLGSIKTKTKTTKQSTVYALDRDKERLASLQRRMQQLVPTNSDNKTQTSSVSGRVQVETRECDFLQTNPDDFPTVGAILLDPSCSGSGIQTAPDRWTDSNSSTGNNNTMEQDEKESHRVDSLAKFQEKALKHAMSFPNVSRIVYSTCSVHERENEQVVVNALNASSSSQENDNSSHQDWKIVAPTCMDSWKRRGHVVEGLSEEDAQCMIRAIAPEDETNGFFVCCLERQTGNDKKERKEPKQMTPSLSMVETPKGTSLYKGQFATKKEVKTLKKNTSNAESDDKSPSKKSKPSQDITNKPASKPSQDITSKPAKATKRKKSKQEVPKEAVKSQEQDPATAEKIPKKVAKKLAWKKRQMELKQQRLTKKQKTSEE